MNAPFQIRISADTASPALREAFLHSEPRRVGETLRNSLLALVRLHYETLPHNKFNWPPVGFWGEASASTYGEVTEDGVSIVTTKVGVRQRLLGGSITAARAKNLALPACAESCGKSPREMGDLVFVQFGRGQDAPKALVRVSGSSSRGTAAQKQIARKVMFWLKESVQQPPNPNVLPSDDEFFSAAGESLKGLS